MTGTQVIIVGNARQQNKNDPMYLQQALQERELTAEFVDWHELLFEITNEVFSVTKDGAEMPPAPHLLLNWYRRNDYLFHRDVAYTLALYAVNQGMPVWNSEAMQQRSMTKLSCMALLRAAQVPTPATLYSLDGQLLHEAALARFDFPMVVKSITGRRGGDNQLVQDKAELEAVLRRRRHNKLMVQPFIRNSFDFRIVCVGGEPSFILKRQRQQSEQYLNNTSQGAASEVIGLNQVPSSVLEIARTAANALHRELGGVDLLFKDDNLAKPICLEINVVPQLTSGAFVNQKMDALAGAIKKEFRI